MAPKKRRLESRKYRELESKIVSRDYKIYSKKEKEKLTWFEVSARTAERFIKVNPDKKTAQTLSAAIGFANLRITPVSVMSLMILTILLGAIFGFTVMLSFQDFTAGIIVIVGGVGLSYYFLKYPSNLVKALRIKASSQVVLAVLYMVVSMRMSPNLERALKFAAANISGELAFDLRRLLWDIWMRRYNSANEALTDYIAKWKPENEEFAESLRLIRDSQLETPDRAEASLDASLEMILDGTKTRMKHYTQELTLPITVIHMMGIILPVLGTIMAPLATVFLPGQFRAEFFVLGYDILLPLFILWFIRNTLNKRPITFSQIDIRNHPDVPPTGSFVIKSGKKKISFPVLPIAIIVLVLTLLPAIYYFGQNPQYLFPNIGSGDIKNIFPTESLYMSILIIAGIGISASIYFILSNFQALRVQESIQATENEFELALFQLGNRIGAGLPVESAIAKSLDDIKDLEIAGLFKIALYNMRNQGMTLEDAFFDKKRGAIVYYPSRLIRNVMSTVVDTARKGFSYAADSMMTISKYMKNVRETQEYIRELLSETVSSMKFQAYILTPMITGLIVSMSQIILKVLSFLGQNLQSSFLGGGENFGLGASSFVELDKVVSPSVFQLIVGVYLLEVIVILAIFLTKISYGENNTLKWYSAGKMLAVGVAVYFIVSIISVNLFVPLIENALVGIGK